MTGAAMTARLAKLMSGKLDVSAIALQEMT